MEVYSKNKTQLWINAPVAFALKDSIYIGYVVGVEITAAGINRLEVMVDDGKRAYSEYIYDPVVFATNALAFPVLACEDLNKAVVLTTPVFDIPVKDKRVKGKNYSYDEVVDFFEKRIRKLRRGDARYNQRHNLSLTNNGERIGITVNRSQEFDWFTNQPTGQVRVSLDSYAYNVSHSCDGKDLLHEPRLMRAAKETLE